VNTPRKAETAAHQETTMSQSESVKNDICQLQGIIRSSPAVKETGLPPVVRVKRALKRRLSVKAQRRIKGAVSSIRDWLDRRRGKAKPVPSAPDSRPPQRLEAGDLVRVRSREEIGATLDHWRSLKGCGFLNEMAGYCGTTQRVLKRVERFIDERDYRSKRASGIVLLEGVLCSGTGTTGRCDRACFFFWREEWLEKLGSSERN
jgi:hypothetical protein